MWIGFLLSLASTLVNVSGLLLLKRAIDIVAFEAAGLSFRQYFSLIGRSIRTWHFLLGSVLYVLGYAVRLLAITFADLSYVRLIYVSHLVLVFVGSKFFLHEKIGRSLLVALALTMAGFVAMLLSPALTREGADSGILSIYLLVVLPSAMGALVASLLVKRLQSLFLCLSAGLFYAVGVVGQGIISTTFLGNANLDILGLVMLLREPVVYLIFLFSAMGFFTQNISAHGARLSNVYPIGYLVSEITSFLGSIMIFHEDYSLFGQPLRFLGLSLILSGLGVFSVIASRKRGEIVPHPRPA